MRCLKGSGDFLVESRCYTGFDGGIKRVGSDVQLGASILNRDVALRASILPAVHQNGTFTRDIAKIRCLPLQLELAVRDSRETRRRQIHRAPKNSGGPGFIRDFGCARELSPARFGPKVRYLEHSVLISNSAGRFQAAPLLIREWIDGVVHAHRQRWRPSEAAVARSIHRDIAMLDPPCGRAEIHTLVRYLQGELRKRESEVRRNRHWRRQP